MISKKVMLAGNFGVGKTSLFNRFIQDIFDERYLTTIGVKVDSKVVSLDNDDQLKLMIWDIAGEVSQTKVPQTYWLGASGILYVFDLTRPTTFERIEEDIAFLKQKLPDCVIKLIGNKKDLVSTDRIEEVKSKFDVDAITSAKTGEQVEDVFLALANDIYAQTQPM